LSKALSLDLRVRVLAAVEAGATHREAGERSGGNPASVSRLGQREREEGEPRPKALGGDRCLGRIEAHHDAVLAALGPAKDATTEEVRLVLSQQVPTFGFGSIQRFFAHYKALLRKAAKRTVERLWSSIGELLTPFKPAKCRNYFAAAGHDAD
jgi:transposase